MFLKLLIILLLTCFSLQAKINSIKENSDKIIIEFDFNNEIKIEDYSVNGSIYQKLVSEKFISKGNYPEIEYLENDYIFAVPQNSNPSLTYKIINTSDLKQEKLLLSQVLNDNSEIRFYEYSKEQTKNRIIPNYQEQVSIKSLGLIDENLLYSLNIKPIIFNNNQAKLIKKLIVEIDYGAEFSNFTSNKKSDVQEFDLLNKYTAQNNKIKFRRKGLEDCFLNDQTDWIKLKVDKEGLYKITGRDLINYGISLDAVQKEYLRVLSSAGEDLSKNVMDNDFFHGAVEIPRRILDKNNNGLIDSDDEIIFYSQGISFHQRTNPDSLQNYRNYYSDYAYIWIDPGYHIRKQGLDMEEIQTEDNENAEMVFNNFYKRIFSTKMDKFNLSGYKSFYSEVYYGFELTSGNILNLDLHFDKITGNYVYADILYPSFSGNSGPNVRYLFNNNPQSSIISQNDIKRKINAEFFIENNTNQLTLSHLGNVDYSKYMERIIFFYLSNIDLDNDKNFNTFAFKAQNNGWAQLNFEGTNGRYYYDVSDPKQVKFKKLDSNNLIYEVKEGYNFAIFDKEYLSPLEGAIYNNTGKQSLHSLDKNYDMIVITADKYYDILMPSQGRLHKFLEYDIEYNHEIDDILVVKISDINNEFGRGYQEESATRNFIKYAYENYNTEYILLIGSGHYDYKKILNNENDIFPCRYNSHYGDYFYAILDSASSQAMNLAIGRFPVKTRTELIDLASKYLDMYENTDYGNWSNAILFAGDDEHNPDRGGSGRWSETEHIKSIEGYWENFIPNSFEANKIFMTEYPFKEGVSGMLEKPKASEDMLRSLNDGVASFAYSGHGSPYRMAHENLFSSANLPGLNNYRKYFLAMAASCDNGVFADQKIRSLFDLLLITPRRGAIATIGSMKATFASPNKTFFGNLLKEMFTVNNGRYNSIGKAFMKATVRGNNQSYILAGNPAYTIYRNYQGLQSEDNLEFKTLKLDSFKIKMENNIVDLNSFQGNLNVKILDASRKIGYYNDQYWSLYNIDTLWYNLPGNTVLNTGADFVNDLATIRYILPKDVNYGDKKAKALFYAYDPQFKERINGYQDSISIRGSFDIIDSIPPQISIKFDDLNYKEGDPISKNPKIFLLLEDENGINTSGQAGHNIILNLNGASYDLTGNFQYFNGSYQKGYTYYQIMGLDEGEHEILAKAYDTSNNYNEKRLKFTIKGDKETKRWIGNVLNYPNPVKSRGTNFTFSAQEPENINKVVISIYTQNGRLIKKIRENNFNTSSNFQKIFWNGKDSDGQYPGNGVYFYKLEIEYKNKRTFSKIEKLLFTR